MSITHNGQSGVTPSSPTATSFHLQSVLEDLDGCRERVARQPQDKDTQQLFAALNCLKQISKTEIGAKLLGNIKNSGKDVVIHLNDKGGGSAHSKDLSIKFDPKTKKQYLLVKDNVRQLGESSPSALLFHELAHINQFINAPTCYAHKDHHCAPSETSLDEEYDNLQEWDVIHGRSKDDFSENAYRREAGMPLRVTHRAVSEEEANKIHSMTKESTSGPTAVTEQNEDEVREVLLSIVRYGLEVEAKALMKNYKLRFSDFQFVATHMNLADFKNTERQYDGVRSHILALMLGTMINEKDPSGQGEPAKVFLKSLFSRSTFECNDFQKKLCRHLPLSVILERTPIVQKAIKEENTELLEYLVREKGLKSDSPFWHGRLKQSLTVTEYATRCKWDADSIAGLFPRSTEK